MCNVALWVVYKHNMGNAKELAVNQVVTQKKFDNGKPFRNSSHFISTQNPTYIQPPHKLATQYYDVRYISPSSEFKKLAAQGIFYCNS